MNSDELAKRIVARLGAAGGELPALVIRGNRYGLSTLAAMPADQRRQWGENIAESIENFLNAVNHNDNMLVLNTNEVTALPESGWMIMQIATSAKGTEVSAIVKGQTYPLLRTGMDMGAI